MCDESGSLKEGASLNLVSNKDRFMRGGGLRYDYAMNNWGRQRADVFKISRAANEPYPRPCGSVPSHVNQLVCAFSTLP